MNKFVRFAPIGIFGALLLNVAATAARADIRPNYDDERRRERFNIQCDFEDKDKDHDQNHDRKECKVFAEFEKRVSHDGGEVTDDSDDRDNPKFEIECNGKWIYKDHARRFTEIIGTRIQAEEGPFPALVLSRGELHEGPHYSEGRLEVDNDLALHGSCFIYTGEGAIGR